MCAIDVDLRAMLSDLAYDVLVLTDEGTIEYVTPSLAQNLDYTRGEMEGSTLAEYLHDGDVDSVHQFLSELDEPDGNGRGTLRIDDAKGTVRRFDVTRIEALESDLDGHGLRLCEITTHETRERSLEEFAHLLEQLHTVTNQLYAVESVEEALDIVTDGAVEVLGFDWCLLQKATDGMFEIRAASDESPLGVGERALATDEGEIGAVYQSGKSRLTREVQESQTAKPTHEFIRSSITVPVGSWGVFQALSTSPNAFDERDLQLAETLITPLATTIERIQKEQRLRDSRGEQQRQRQQIEALHAVATEMKTATSRDRVYEMMIGVVETILEFDICIVDEIENDVLVPRAVGSNMSLEDYYEETPIDRRDNLGSKTYREGETFVVDDLHEAGFAPAQSKYQSAISVPLGDWGVFQIAAERAGAFDGTDRRLVELLTEHAIAAVDRIERERKLERQNEELERVKDRFQGFVENASDIVSVIDENGTIVYESPAVERILGYEQGERVGENVFEYVHPEAREHVVERFSELIAGSERTPRQIEHRFEHADGSWVWLESVGSNQAGSTIEGYVINSRDVTARKEREQELQRQNEQLEQVASILSHDLRNPLNVATIRTKLARKETDVEHLDDVQAALSRMEDLIDDVLTLARLEETVESRDEIELRRLVKDAWRQVPGDGASLSVVDSRTLEADRTRLAQVFENVFRNAVEHAGSNVTVEVGLLEDGLYVEDDGPGIDEEIREEIFERGYSGEDDGSGLGLSIVRQIVEAHDWEITVTEGEQGGARFEISGIEMGE